LNLAGATPPRLSRRTPVRSDSRQIVGELVKIAFRKSLPKLWRFLDAEAKLLGGNGIRPIEPGPFKIVEPAKQVRYTRLCPFCRKTRAKFSQSATNISRASARSAERAGRSARDTRRHCELGMAENDWGRHRACGGRALMPEAGMRPDFNSWFVAQGPSVRLSGISEELAILPTKH
jgi:hypothetical protein